MSDSPISVSAAWRAAGWTMLHMVWIGAIAGLAMALLRRLLRPVRPEIRHGVAVAFLLLLTSAPVILFARLYRPEPAKAIASAQATRMAVPGGPAIAPMPPPPAIDRLPTDLGPDPVTSTTSVFARFEPLVGYLPGVWLSGSLATLALIATGLAGVERLRRSSRPLEAGPIGGQCRALAASLGVARRVGVAICDRIAAPVLVGIVRPLILLPPAALGGWGIEQLEMALLHELAHIRRHDNLITLLQRLAESLLFFHPVTWWLSGWISLERELCCDRLVVRHTGRPQAYARMLAALAGAGPGSRTMALAMAERPLTTRIRRILDMEDRSMKLTLTEGLGLLAIVVAGSAFTLAAHAGPAAPVPQDESRRTLERLVRGIVATPEGREPDAGRRQALIEVAKAQAKLGDRAAAMETLRSLDRLAESTLPKAGEKLDLRAWAGLIALIESAELRRDLGDRDGALRVLDRATHSLDALDAGTIRAAFQRVEKEMDAAFRSNKPEEERRLTDEEAAMVCEGAVYLVDQSINLGDHARARALSHRMLEAIGPPAGPMKAVIVAHLGHYLVKAGDTPAGWDAIRRARQASLGLANAEARAFVLLHVARTLSDAGELDEALGVLREIGPMSRQAALRELLEGMSNDDRSIPWFAPGGITIKIGEPSLSPKDPAAARVALPKIAAAVRALNDAKVQARTLAVVAHLQARAGDVTGALATARSIPDLKRSDFPEPSDGFYDAVKPVTFALVAGVQAKAGDASGATATLAEAEALARAITAEDQKLIAQIAIAQKQAMIGRRDAARAVVAETLPLALTQPEPRRSRVLAMLADAQVQAADAAGALRTIDSIRDYPGLEKAHALSVLARWHEEAGDAETSERLLRRAADVLEAKAPETPLPGKVTNVRSFSRDTFIDPDLELSPPVLKYHRETTARTFRTQTAGPEAAIRAAGALPPVQRDHALAQIAVDLLRRGDAARAMDLAASIESPDVRLAAFAQLAFAIPERQAKK